MFHKGLTIIFLAGSVLLTSHFVKASPTGSAAAAFSSSKYVCQAQVVL